MEASKVVSGEDNLGKSNTFLDSDYGSMVGLKLNKSPKLSVVPLLTGSNVC